jgi:hypothetical protein
MFMDNADLKKDGTEESTDSLDSEADLTRPDPASSLSQVKPGTPWGVAKPHIYTHARHALGDSSAIQAVYRCLELPDPLKRFALGFLGNFGSGKTEVAVNFAMQLGLASMRPDDPIEGPITIIDMDIVNPYFRSREAIVPLHEAGVEVVAPAGEKFWADLPIILPEVKGHIQRGEGTLVLDVGGDDLGARVLSHLSEEFDPETYTLMMVVNANRPFTAEVEGAKKVLGELEVASGLKIGGLIANTHLMDFTDADEVRRGYEFTKKISDETGLPLLMVTAESRLIEDGGLVEDEFDCLLLPLYRFMLPPWRSGELGNIKGRFRVESEAVGQNSSDES